MSYQIIRKTKTSVVVKNVPLFVTIYEELRPNARASMGKTGAILRLPAHLTKAVKDKQWQWFMEWLEQQLESEKVQNHIKGRGYNDQDILQIYGRSYRLHISSTDTKNHTAYIENRNLYIELTKTDSAANLARVKREFVSKLVAIDCFEAFSERVDFWNNNYFREDYGTIRLKHNQSNWGSCSSRRNLNFSTRLLFAPPEVIDYVIVHELSHLKELNHSPRYWQIVRNVMPDFERHEAWLTENGASCDF
jgi:predicted metal-dependent hydrolase